VLNLPLAPWARTSGGGSVGFEYKIAFRVPDLSEVESFLNRLRKDFASTSGPGDFTVAGEADGFYFCDHTKSERSSCAFRRLVDEALQYSEVVIHEV
jgi:hypothetical protein